MRYLTIFTLIFLYGFTKAQSLQFYREDINFTINNGYFYVDGIYNFCNNGDNEIKKTLFYPFPQNDLNGDIDSVFAIDLENNISVLSKNGETGAFFYVDIEPYGVGSFRVGYRQKINGNKAEYILLTTKNWRTPFDNAYYKLNMPDKYSVEFLSYKPDSVKLINQNNIYYWTKKDFMPDRNFIVEFK